MNTGSMIKLGINLVAASGVTKVLGDVIKNNVTIVTTKDALLVKTGTLVLGSMITERAFSHVNGYIDNVTKAFNSFGNKEETEKTGDQESEDEDLTIIQYDDPPDVEK